MNNLYSPSFAAIKRIDMQKECQALRLCRWYQKHRRSLPWRKTRDPYRIWVSEVMLQQTQVNTVIPYYERFLRRFPTIECLASARESTVLTFWSGLGYYSRARNLQRGARYVINYLNGRLPSKPAELLKVPGIGRYTAGAIASIAFDEPAPIVDGNVHRVFSRVYASRESKTSAFYWQVAEQWVRQAESPGTLNQALMELGALICTKDHPICQVCPLKADCLAFKRKEQTIYPHKPRSGPSVKILQWFCFIFEKKGLIYLKKNPAGGWWENLWDFPWIDQSKFQGTPNKTLGSFIHCVTKYQIHVSPMIVAHPSRRGLLTDLTTGGQWLTQAQVSRKPLSSLAKKVLAHYVEAQRSREKLRIVPNDSAMLGF